MNPAKLFFISCFVLLQTAANAQQKDSLIINNDSAHLHQPAKDILLKKDSTAKKKHSPRKATLYSTILPGAGQVYNKKYWKVPIVYAALGIPAYFYFDNKNWYRRCQYALAVAINLSTNGSVTPDSLNAVHPKLLPFVRNGQTNYIINYRNEFRKDQDYSALFLLIFWGLNIVDATVDAHLKDFNVSDDLSFRIKPAFIPGPSYAGGISFVFDIHKGKSKLIDLRN